MPRIRLPKKGSLSIRNVAGKKPIIRISCQDRDDIELSRAVVKQTPNVSRLAEVGEYERGCLHRQTDIGGCVHL